MMTYLKLLEHVVKNGEYRPDRTGTGTWSVFGEMLSVNLNDGFPLLTTKKVHWKSIVHELLWMLNGNTNISYLKENGVSIWDEWADVNGDLGPVYGKQWRNFSGVDQIQGLLTDLINNKYSRRHLVSAWNPGELKDMALPPCHVMFQFHINTKEELSCLLYQRSADIFLGVPFNIAFYALLTNIIAKSLKYNVGYLKVAFGDLHLYSNHIEQAKTQLSREPYDLPTLMIKDRTSIFDHVFEDFTLINYKHHPAIKADVSV